MDDPFAQIGKKLDEVVGARYREPGAGERIAKWLLAGACAVGAMCVVVWMIESHRLPPEGARAPAKKPVMIEILPAPSKP